MATDENRTIAPELAEPELLAPELLAMVRCPRCRGTLHPAPAALRCDACRLLFGVAEGVPNFLLEDARPAGADAR